jgi:hypothetical protein
MTDYVDVVFDCPPGPETSPRFIEVEDATRRSIRFGTWIERDDGRWALRITRADFEKRPAIDTDQVQAALDRVAEQVRREGPGDGRFRPPPGYQDPWSRKR